jgi:hypothetical protein
MTRLSRVFARTHFLLVALAAVACACATLPSRPASGTGGVWGQIRLVPHEGVVPGGSGSAAYRDRALRDVRFVDYSRPGPAVVYVDEPSGAPVSARLAIRGAAHRVRLTPSFATSSNGGSIRVENESNESHALSVPTAGIVRRIEPGQIVEIAVPGAGPHSIHLLDAADAKTTVFVSTGPSAVVTERGRFELTDLAPGPRVIRAWHPRFPPSRRSVEIRADEALEVDIELGVEASYQ